MNDQFSDVWINIREPFSKNVVWIYLGEIVEIRIYQNGWKTIATSADLGLGNKSKEEINTLLEEHKNNILDILNNKTKRCISDILVLYKKYRDLQNEIEQLKITISKLQKLIGRRNGK